MPLQSAAVAQGWAPGSEDGVCSGRAQEAQSARTAKERIRNATSEKGTLAGARPAFYRTCVVGTSAKKINFFSAAALPRMASGVQCLGLGGIHGHRSHPAGRRKIAGPRGGCAALPRER